MADDILGVILAAGSASRYGSNKALAYLEDKPLLERVWDQLPVKNKTIITGAYHEELSAFCNHKGYVYAFNKNHGEGISSSRMMAIELALSRKQKLLLTLADLPWVTPTDYEGLIKCHLLTQKSVFSRFNTDEGTINAPPVLFSAQDLHLLAQNTDMHAPISSLVDYAAYPNPNAAKDIDTRQDLKGG